MYSYSFDCKRLLNRGVVHSFGFFWLLWLSISFFLDFLVLYNFENSENFTNMPNVCKEHKNERKSRKSQKVDFRKKAWLFYFLECTTPRVEHGLIYFSTNFTSHRTDSCVDHHMNLQISVRKKTLYERQNQK